MNLWGLAAVLSATICRSLYGKAPKTGTWAAAWAGNPTPDLYRI